MLPLNHRWDESDFNERKWQKQFQSFNSKSNSCHSHSYMPSFNNFVKVNYCFIKKLVFNSAAVTIFIKVLTWFQNGCYTASTNFLPFTNAINGQNSFTTMISLQSFAHFETPFLKVDKMHFRRHFFARKDQKLIQHKKSRLKLQVFTL